MHLFNKPAIFTENLSDIDKHALLRFMRSLKAASRREELVQLIRSLISPQAFPEDENKTRKANILNLTLVNVLAIMPILIASNLLGGQIPPSVIVLEALAFILCLIFFYWLHRGQIGLVSIGLVVSGFIGITIAIANLGTIRAPATAMYLLLIIAAGLLFDLRGVIVTTAISSLMVGGLLVAENMALLPPPNYSTTITQWIAYAGMFGLAGSLTSSSLRSMNSALARADKELEERKRAEAELAEHRDHLKELVRESTTELKAKNTALSEKIAERKLAEEALMIERDLAERYLNIAEVIIVVLDTQARITLLNRKGHQVLGYKEGELIGRDWIHTCLRPQEHERVHEVNRRINAGEIEAFEYYENYVLTKDGEERSIAWHTTILKDDLGHIIGTLSSGEDITERKMAEKRIMESEEKYRQLVENSLIGIGISQGNKVIFANPALLSIFGYDNPDEFLRIPLMDHVAPESRELIAARRRDVGDGKSIPSSFEYAILCKDGRTKVLRASSSIIKLSSDAYTQTTFQDITEQKQMEKALQESEDMYRAIFDNTGTATMIIEDNTIVSIANSELEKLSGYTREEIEGKKSWTEFILKEDLERMLEQHRLRRIDPSCAQNSYEFRAFDKNGEVKNILLRIGIIAGTKKSIASLLDITELKKADEMLRASLSEKELLLKEVHHRVKNNLQIISALLYLQSSNLTDDSTEKIFKDSQDRIKSMALVHENLYKSKDLGNVNFNDYLKQLISHLSQSYGDLSQKISFKVNSDKVFLNINTAIPCGMIINELISNSLKHAFPDGRCGEICIDLSSENDGYRLIVSDNGIGIKGDLNIEDSKTLGLRLIDTLIKQIDGKISFYTTNGIRCEIYFKGIR